MDSVVELIKPRIKLPVFGTVPASRKFLVAIDHMSMFTHTANSHSTWCTSVELKDRLKTSPPVLSDYISDFYRQQSYGSFVGVTKVTPPRFGIIFASALICVMFLVQLIGSFESIRITTLAN